MHVPPMSPETTVTYSPGAGSDSSPNLLAFPASNSISAFKGLDGVYDWHAVTDGDLIIIYEMGVPAST